MFWAGHFLIIFIAKAPVNDFESLSLKLRKLKNQLVLIKEEKGTIDIHFRGDGKLGESWNNIKNANQLTLVRTSEGFGSTNLTHLEPSFQAIKSYLPFNTVLKMMAGR